MTTTANGWDALAERLARVKKPVQTFLLCDDADIRDRYLTAKQEAEQADAYAKTLTQDADADARALVDTQAKAAKTELTAAKKAYDAHTIVLRFQALDRRDLEDLQNKHPASEEDEAKGNDYAFDEFAPALISAASLDGMPVEAARSYLETWTTADATALWRAAWNIQHQQRTDLGKG